MQDYVGKGVQTTIRFNQNPSSMHQVQREFVPTGKEGSLIIGNAKTGLLEIKSNAEHRLDQLIIVKKNGETVELFNPNPIKGVSSAREFHQAFKNNYNLNSPQHTESVYFNVIDPTTIKRIRIFANPQGFYHTNEQGWVDRSRKISYQEMDKLCESTKAYAKKLNLTFYTKEQNTVLPEVNKNINTVLPEPTKQINFTDISKEEGKPQPRLSPPQARSIKREYIAPEEKKTIRICTIL